MFQRTRHRPESVLEKAVLAERFPRARKVLAACEPTPLWACCGRLIRRWGATGLTSGTCGRRGLCFYVRPFRALRMAGMVRCRRRCGARV
jgi:hypothetical protein